MRARDEQNPSAKPMTSSASPRIGEGRLSAPLAPLDSRAPPDPRDLKSSIIARQSRPLYPTGSSARAMRSPTRPTTTSGRRAPRRSPRLGLRSCAGIARSPRRRRRRAGARRRDARRRGRVGAVRVGRRARTGRRGGRDRVAALPESAAPASAPLLPPRPAARLRAPPARSRRRDPRALPRARARRARVRVARALLDAVDAPALVVLGEIPLAESAEAGLDDDGAPDAALRLAASAAAAPLLARLRGARAQMLETPRIATGLAAALVARADLRAARPARASRPRRGGADASRPCGRTRARCRCSRPSPRRPTRRSRRPRDTRPPRRPRRPRRGQRRAYAAGGDRCATSPRER